MAKPTFRTGTALDASKVADGYVGSGESVFSRRAAHPENSVKLRADHAYKTKGAHSRARLIKETASELARLRCDLRIETNAQKLAKLRSNIEIKERFLKRLNDEVASERIETIPGADEFEPWSKIK
jgi:hypothetical protein